MKQLTIKLGSAVKAMSFMLALACGSNVFAAEPDFTGVWQAVQVPDALLTHDGKLPPLTSQGQQLYAEHQTARKRGALSFDNTTQCQPPGLPRAYFMGMPFEVQQEDTQLYVLFQWNRLFRAVDFNITHEQQNMYAPTYFGFATGAWDNNTLVIDSVLFNDMTLLDAAGLPHSTDMHLVERWTLTKDGKFIDATVTIEDPQYYAMPWSFNTRFKRMPAGTQIQEDVCLERIGRVKRPASHD